MLIRLAIAAILLAFAPVTPAFAQNDPHRVTQSGELDALFAGLAASTDEPSARAIADAIWTIWTQPDDPVLAARIAEIMSTSGFAGPAGQLPLIQRLVEDYPDYPEAWNLRATAHFLRGNQEAALADIAETLRLEPRHFGAWAGKALILHNQGKRDEALAAIRAGLDIHPFLPERSLFPELASPPIRSRNTKENNSMAEAEYHIAREEGPTRGRYVIHLAPGAEAEMTYRKSGDGPMIIDHTGVPPEFEGRGIAAQLVKAAIADARAQGFKINPVCPYVVVQFRRHPEWADLLG